MIIRRGLPRAAQAGPWPAEGNLPEGVYPTTLQRETASQQKNDVQNIADAQFIRVGLPRNIDESSWPSRTPIPEDVISTRLVSDIEQQPVSELLKSESSDPAQESLLLARASTPRKKMSPVGRGVVIAGLAV